MSLCAGMVAIARTQLQNLASPFIGIPLQSGCATINNGLVTMFFEVQQHPRLMLELVAGGDLHSSSHFRCSCQPLHVS